MKSLFSILENLKSAFSRKERKTIADYKEEMLLRYGSEQFRTLVKKGLGIPVMML